MAEIGRDPAGFEFALQVPTGTGGRSRRDGLALALEGVAAGATYVVLSMPPGLGPNGIDLVAREMAVPLREATG